MKQLAQKLLSMLLSLTLVLQLCPVYAHNSETTPAPASESTTPGTTATVVSEETSLREEDVKHFLMADGTYTAVQYPFAVHWSSGSGWQDYDNTLKAVKTESFTGYTIENGYELRSFSTDGTAGALYTASTEKTAVSFTLAGD